MMHGGLIGKDIDIEDLYKVELLGIWDKENPSIKKVELIVDNVNLKKEGNEMIESMNLIDLYASKHKEKIEKETNEKVEELRKDCDVINKYNELCEQFKKDCDDLYSSQFTEEEKTNIIADRQIEDADKQLQRKYASLKRYEVNSEFKPVGFDDVMNKNSNELDKINDLVKTVKAHIGIAKTKEEVEEILTRYGIIDKKGKLVTE